MERPQFGGVCTAISGRLLAGPMCHARSFIDMNEGSLFSNSHLPHPTERYVVSCVMPHSALPQCQANAPATRVKSNSGARGDDLPDDTMAAVTRMKNNAAQFLAALNARRPKGNDQQPTTPHGAGPSSEASVQHQQPAEARLRSLATENEAIQQAAESALGTSHFFQCVIRAEGDDDTARNTASINEAIEFIENRLSGRSPQAVVYVFSDSGRGSAPAVVMGYLQRIERMPLSAIADLLPLSTPPVTYLRDLIRADAEAGNSFDSNAYFVKYFSRRYPSRTTTDIEAALTTCRDDYAMADRLLWDQHLFHSSSSRSAYIVEKVAVATPMSASIAPTPGFHDVHEHSQTSDAVRRTSTPSALAPTLLSVSNNSLTSCSASVSPVVLSVVDEDMIASLSKALLGAGMPASVDAVRDSYVRHRRNKDRVLKEFLKSPVNESLSRNRNGPSEVSFNHSLSSEFIYVTPQTSGNTFRAGSIDTDSTPARSYRRTSHPNTSN